MKRLLEAHSALLFGLLLLICAAFAHAQVSPFMGVGNVQFFDNNGHPLTSGVLYSFQAGTTTQQATYTDYTGLIANPNPLPFGSGARVAIWLTTSATYKFVLCSQNDGVACASADVLFSIDQVPGGSSSSGGGGGSGTFTGVLVSASGNPASSGIVRVASGDAAVCFRNTSNSANLCIAKDTSDVLNWATNTFKLPESNCSATGAGFDYLCASSATHRLQQSANNGSYSVLPGTSTSAATSGHLVTYAASGYDIQDSGLTATFPNFEMALTTLQNFSGSSGASFICQSGAPTAFEACYYYTFTNAHTVSRLIVAVNQAPVTCSPNATVGIKDVTSGTVLLSATPTTTGIVTTTGSATIPAGDVIGVGLLTASAGCATPPSFQSVSAIYQ